MTTEKKGKAKKTETQAAEAVQPSTATETNTTVESVTLTVNDLQLIAQIVDLASQRGAFRAPELEQVGTAYNKLAGFLKYVQSTQEKEKADAEQAATATSDAE
jgi:hypothetical protein